MQSTPKSLRLHIGIFGRRNVGKSSLLNAILRQDVSIVSAHAGTTTDPVEKPMELLPLGPVLFVDTAGIDDAGDLGERRVARTRAVFDRVDLAILVTDRGRWDSFEDLIWAELKQRHVPTVVVLNKLDEGEPLTADLAPITAHDLPMVRTSARHQEGIIELQEALLQLAPGDHFESRHLISDLVPPGEAAVLVVPIDKEAPKGRIILPQVMAIRDLLDGGSMAFVTQERELPRTLATLNRPPALVVTDSQAFQSVGADVPPDIPMTSFSILMARFQGDLVEQVRGTLGIARLKHGSKVLIAETCGHHPIGEDIGRVKIPRWLREFTGAALTFQHVQGRDFPGDLTPYDLVIHCGNCTGNRREMLSRIHRCRMAGVPITNYGLTIAYALGILERALAPFPAALDACRKCAQTDL